MIVECIHYQIEKERWLQFEEDYRMAGATLLQSPHCLFFDLSKCLEDPEKYTLRIHWDSEEGHLRGFRNSPQFEAFFAHVKAYVTNIREVSHYFPTWNAERLPPRFTAS